MFYRGIYADFKYMEKLRRQRMLKEAEANSDSPNEDKGFNMCHSQTSGGEEAYDNGELPKTYLSKKVMLSKLKNEILKLKNSKENLKNFVPRPEKIINFIFSKTIEEIMEELNNMFNKEEFFNTFFIYSGVHYTGRYYRYTKFYKVISGEDLLIALAYHLYHPSTYEQLQIKF